MDSTMLDTARKSSKTCQIEGCHETTVGSRTALCRKHRNNRYKQNYKKKKRRAQGSDVSSPKGFKYFKSYQLCNVQSLRFQQKHYFSVRYKLLPRHKSHVFVKLIFPLFISHCFNTDFNSMVYLTGCIVAMEPCFVKRMTAPYLPLIGHLCDFIIGALLVNSKYSF